MKKVEPGTPQTEREQNAQARLRKFRSLKPHEQEQTLRDEMNYSLNGGLRGLVHAAKTYMDDPNRPPEAQALYAEAAGWGSWALKSQKNPWLGEMRLAAAVACADLVSKATRTYAIGWIGNGIEKGNFDGPESV